MALKKSKYSDEAFARRRFPRRSYVRKVGVLSAGQFIVCEAGELSEGGISFKSEFLFNVEKELLINFQIPNGSFAFLRAIVKSTTKQDGLVVHGLSFVDVPFQHRRQIRAYVSERVSEQSF